MVLDLHQTAWLTLPKPGVTFAYMPGLTPVLQTKSLQEVCDVRLEQLAIHLRTAL
jgi:hypothetical protein